MKRTKNISALCLTLLWIISSSFFIYVDESLFNQQALFKICRNLDVNEIWYVLNFKQNGLLDRNNPIRAFWYKKTENNKIEPLTWIQNRYSYGVKIVDSETQNNNSWQFHFVSYSKRKFELRKFSNNKYKVFTKSANKEIEVTGIFVQIDGGSFWFPTVSFVQLLGIETLTGKEIIETIIP